MMKFRSILIRCLVLLLMIAPLAVYAQLVPCGRGGDQCTLCHFMVLINNIMQFLLFKLALPAGVITLIIAGVTLLTASGNEQQINTGKKILINVVWGLVIAFGAWLIVDLIIRGVASESFFGNGFAWNEFPDCAVDTFDWGD